MGAPRIVLLFAAAAAVAPVAFAQAPALPMTLEEATRRTLDYISSLGERMSCRILDLSLSGAALAAESKPPMKSMVRIGCVPARVVRYLEEGFALEFIHPQDPETLEESVTMR